MSEAADSKLEPGHRARAWIGLAFLVALLVVAFWWTGRWLGARWDQPNSYYSHGWLIGPISLFLVYMKRKELARCEVAPTAWGLAVLVPALMLHLLATVWQVGFLSGFALVGAVAGLVLGLFGWQVFRTVLFPIVFLFFLVPLPEVLIETFSFRLKLLAAQVTATILSVFGFPAVREGSYIRIPAGTIVVDDVCSGLKYLIALTAFGALYAYISPLKKWRQWALFGLSIPVAFLANVARVTLMVLVAFALGIGATEEWYFHDFFGFFLFVVAFLMLFLSESVLLKDTTLNRWSSSEGDEDGEEEAAEAAPEGAFRIPALKRPVPLVMAGLLLVTGALSLYLTRPRPVPDPSVLLQRIPLEIGEWRGTEYELDRRTLELLGTEDVLSRSYRRDPGDPPVQLLVVLAQQIRRRTHPPEQCLTGGGSSIVRSEIWKPAIEGAPEGFAVRELELAMGNGRMLTWYFYKTGDHLNTSYWAHQARVAFSKVTNPGATDILVRVETPMRGTDRMSARSRMRDFLTYALPGIMERLP